MPAVITDRLKKQIIQDLYDDVQDSAQTYYIGIGRSEQWNSTDTVQTPSNCGRCSRNARLSLQSIKLAEAASFATKRTNWSSGTIYSAYDDAVAGIPAQNYFVITNANQVYICLKQGRNNSGVAVASTVEPTGTSTSAFTTSDGYTWKFLYSVSTLNATNFLTANYIPVRFIDSGEDIDAISTEQKGIQDAAVVGQITDIRITSAGAGYTSKPTVTIVGNGTGATAVATIDSSLGQVVNIEMANDSSAFGSGYDYASVVLSGGGATTQGKARAVLSTPLGIGGDPRDDLKANAIIFNSKLDGAEGGDFLVGQDFRQIVIIKNPELPDSDGLFKASTGLGLKRIRLSAVTSAFTADDVIIGGTSGAKAYLDAVDADSDILYIHQTESTGFAKFINGEVLTESDGSGSGSIDNIDSADSAGEFDLFSGEVLYVDNRAAVERNTAQTEDIKVVLQL